MGLELNKGESAVKRIDLTEDIQSFTNSGIQFAYRTWARSLRRLVRMGPGFTNIK